MCVLYIVVCPFVNDFWPCVVCFSIYGFWLPLWYLQTLTSITFYHRKFCSETKRSPVLKFKWYFRTLPKHLSSPLVFSGVRVNRSLVLCVCNIHGLDRHRRYIYLYLKLWFSRKRRKLLQQNRAWMTGCSCIYFLSIRFSNCSDVVALYYFYFIIF
jgi:hypothetical protein